MITGIVVPCYNEADRWDPDYWAPLFAIQEVSWLLVDDGSTDTTFKALSKHVDENVNVLSLPSNLGKGEAVRQGLLQSAGSDPTWVGFIDADGAFAAHEVGRFVALAREAPFATKAIWSSRVRMRGRSIQRSVSRHAVGRSIATALSLRYPRLPYDSQAGLKLFRVSPELGVALQESFRTRWLFDVELYTRLEKIYETHPDWLWEEPLDYWRHVPGSKISTREASRIPIEVAQLLAFWKRT